MAKFFEGLNQNCDHWNGGCDHKKNTRDRECDEGYCPLLIEVGLVSVKETEKISYIVDMFQSIKAAMPLGTGIDQFAKIVRLMLVAGYKIVRVRDKKELVK